MTKSFTRFSFFAVIMFLFLSSSVFAQTSISGVVKDSQNGEELAGVNVLVKGKVVGTITDFNGKFQLDISTPHPLTLVFSFVGYKPQELAITEATTTGIEITLEESTILGEEVVVSASRVEESILESPVSIEKMDILAVQNAASDSYYKSIANLKGVDMSSSSINFQIVNSRGFNSTGNTRFVQLIDGMDTQAPALNFPIGSLNGPSDLDVESIELIPGAASALYGPNAFNGILLINSKSPFDYQGFSGTVKLGVNHIGDSDLNSEGLGEIGPGSSKMTQEVALRYAKAFNNKFAFKVNFAYSDATDWYGTNYEDKESNRTPTGFTSNPGSDLVHAYGDEVANDLGLLKLSLAGAFPQSELDKLPNHIVSRTPYMEQDLVDYGAKNLKINTGLHYRLSDRFELLYNLNYGSGTTVYTGAQRYSLKNFNIQQHKLELKADNFFLRGYTTIENSGDSYIADLTGVLVNDAWKSNTDWFVEYAAAYIGAVGSNDPTDPNVQAGAHSFARGIADTGRLEPGSEGFNSALNTATSSTIPTGSKFDDKTKLYHVEGQYDFKNQIDFMGLQVGASYKLYDLNSNGTVFADTTGNDITIQEIGAYAQLSKKFANDKIKLTGSLRYDKNENFDAQLNPRISGVFTVAENNNIRVSYQTGFRNPTTQGQHIDLNVVSARLLGGLPQYAQARNIYENAYTMQSVNEFVGAVATAGDATALGDPANLALLVPADQFDPVVPEQVQSIEVGYKAILGKNLFLDVAYYRNEYKNFITQVQLRKAAGVIDQDVDFLTESNIRNAQTLLTPITTPGKENTFQTYTNIKDKVVAQGFVFGADYNLPKGYSLGFNYNWNKLNEAVSEEYINEFNTPESKYNFSFANRKLTDNIGFNITYRWQDAFKWEASFAQGDVPAIGTLDAMVSYKLKNIKSIIKLGGSNLTNERYVMNYGGPTMGAIYYVSFTFDQFLN